MESACGAGSQRKNKTFSSTNWSRYLIAGLSHLTQTINQVEGINEKHKTKF